MDARLLLALLALKGRRRLVVETHPEAGTCCRQKAEAKLNGRLDRAIE
jgi:hypothetical protein